jgi:glycosyltransferase involved in cell wall biosynthesis
MNANMSDKNIYIFTTSDEPNNVILGHASFAKQAGLQPVFVFPFRKQPYDLQSYSQYEIIRMNFKFSNEGICIYAISIIKFIYYSSKITKINKSNILAIDLTGVLAAAILKCKGNRIYVLVNDNFSARYKMPRALFHLLRWIEGKAYAKLAEVCVFPSKSRYEILGAPKLKKIEYIPNILNDDYIPQWIGSSGDDLVVMLCGWLVKSRGLDILEEIILHADQRVKFILMGSGDDQEIQSICRNDNVTYIGHGSRNEALRTMSNVDINLALYNPEILINRYALPQKIYDALMIGCPVLINSEVEISKELSFKELCFTANYTNGESIANILNNHVENKIKLREMSKKILEYNKENLSYASIAKKGVEVYRMIAKQ